MTLYMEVFAALAPFRRKSRFSGRSRVGTGAHAYLISTGSVGAGPRVCPFLLVLRHSLRAFDAVHLANALAIREEWASLPFYFCSFDKRQVAAARAEKLAVFPVHV